MRREVAGRRFDPIGALILGGALLSAACTGGSEGAEQPRADAFRPSYHAISCPDDVLASIADFRTCGYVTVPEDRRKPEGRTISLFVTHVKTPSADPSPDLMFTLGYDLGWQPAYDSIAKLAEYVHRDVFILDPRGVGHSQPSLSCPEVQALRTSSPDVSTGDPRVLPVFVDAATACHDRLVDDGIDLSAYNLAETAADVEAVRIALAIDRWTLAMRGASSTIGFEVMRRFPEHIQAAYFDSPDAPQVDLFSEAIIGTRYAIARLSEACGDDPRCTRSFPHLEETVRHDLVALHRDPARIPTAAGE